jgi:hypothetical protein
MDKKEIIREHMAKIGSKGGKKATHTLTSVRAKAMVKAREIKRRRKGKNENIGG